MSAPIILSDDEDEEDPNAFSTLFHSKKRRTETYSNPNPKPKPTVLILDDDDPIPQKSGPTSPRTHLLAETPLSDIEILDFTRAPSSLEPKFSGIMVVEEKWRMRMKSIASGFSVVKDLDWSSRFVESSCYLGHDDLAHMSEDSSSQLASFQDDIDQVIGQVLDYPDKENRMDQIGNIKKQRRNNKVISEKENNAEGPRVRKKMTKEERIQLIEAKKLKKLEEKLQREALKAETAEMKKLQKEKQRWEKGKLALKSIVAEVDSKVVEIGSVGGILLTKFAERGVTYRITSNPIERSIVWTMTVPEHISQLSSRGTEIKYILLVYEAQDFCKLIKESLFKHVLRVQRRYPSYTICYLTNRLLAYVSKRDEELFKNPTNHNGWTRPPVEKVLAELTINFVRVHSRQCKDEAELAEHVVGLTCSLSSCQFRKKLTRLDVNADGSLSMKDCVDRNLIRNSPWLKALVAMPKVQPRFAIAIGKKYPTMKSLLSVYMDPNISVHEKEFLLKDLTTEGLLGGDRRLGEVCSKRVYRILMAQSGCIKTDDVEDGADIFRHQWTELP
ncbi:hypothetical protein M0R45_005395 [Rubus argutus]|uniref:Uncharacterized protein n=1 Tax=Rubus argutus TaxID=59490 RepID=A0AAW1YN27_RUBAR